MRFITFATADYLQSAQILGLSVRAYFKDSSFRIYTPADLPGELSLFCNLHPRGHGFWRWKPYIILNELLSLPHNQDLWYIDSGIVLLSGNFPSLENNPFYLQASFFHDVRMWCKPEFLSLARGHSFFHHGVMIDASLIGLKKSQFAIDFISEWYELASQDNLINDFSRRVSKSLFLDHRHDQSILSYLSFFHSLDINTSLSQYSGSVNPIVFHHRLSTQSTFGNKVKQITLFTLYFLYSRLSRFLRLKSHPIPILGPNVFLSLMSKLVYAYNSK